MAFEKYDMVKFTTAYDHGIERGDKGVITEVEDRGSGREGVRVRMLTGARAGKDSGFAFSYRVEKVERIFAPGTKVRYKAVDDAGIALYNGLEGIVSEDPVLGGGTRIVLTKRADNNNYPYVSGIGNKVYVTTLCLTEIEPAPAAAPARKTPKIGDWVKVEGYSTLAGSIWEGREGKVMGGSGEYRTVRFPSGLEGTFKSSVLVVLGSAKIEVGDTVVVTAQVISQSWIGAKLKVEEVRGGASASLRVISGQPRGWGRGELVNFELCKLDLLEKGAVSEEDASEIRVGDLVRVEGYASPGSAWEGWEGKVVEISTWGYSIEFEGYTYTRGAFDLEYLVKIDKLTEKPKPEEKPETLEAGQLVVINDSVSVPSWVGVKLRVESGYQDSWGAVPLKIISGQPSSHKTGQVVYFTRGVLDVVKGSGIEVGDLVKVERVYTLTGWKGAEGIVTRVESSWDGEEDYIHFKITREGIDGSPYVGAEISLNSKKLSVLKSATDLAAEKAEQEKKEADIAALAKKKAGWAAERPVGSVGFQKDGRRVMHKAGVNTWVTLYPHDALDDSNAVTIRWSDKEIVDLLKEEEVIWASES